MPFSKGNKLGFTKGHKRCTGRKNPRWKGGRIFRAGYWRILIHNHPNATKQGYVAEHRVFMEKKIGRYLNKKEVVHHINGVKSDNRISNLMLFSESGQHSQYHALCRDAGKLAYPRKKDTKLRLENMAKAILYTRNQP